MLVCRDVAHTIGIRILWGKCITSAECKTIRIAVSVVMDVGMEAARPKGKEFCFMKGNVFPRVFGKETPVGLVGMYLGGTETIYRNVLVIVRWPGKKNGLSLPMVF